MTAAPSRATSTAFCSRPFPLEYHAEVLGEDTQPIGRLISLGIAALIGMLLLLQVWLGSWRFAALSPGDPARRRGGWLAGGAHRE